MIKRIFVLAYSAVQFRAFWQHNDLNPRKLERVTSADQLRGLNRDETVIICLPDWMDFSQSHDWKEARMGMLFFKKVYVLSELQVLGQEYLDKELLKYYNSLSNQ